MKASKKDFPDKVQQAVQAAVDAYPKMWTSGICAFRTFNRENGNELHGRPASGECHAVLSYGGREQDVCIVVNAHKAAWGKEHPDFLRWVANESPFSHGVLNSDCEEEILGKADVIDCSLVGRGGALWLCKAFRHFTEDKFKLKTWDLLRKQDLDGLQAFVGCDILAPTGKPYNGNTHVSLFAYQSPSALRKVYDEIRTAKRIDGGNANRGGYSTSAHNWGSLAGKEVKKPDGWGGYVTRTEMCDPAEYAAKLKEIFEGDPKNVK